MDNFFHAFGNAVGNAANWVTSSLNKAFQENQRQRQLQQQQYQQVANNVFKFADSTLQSLSSTVQKANPYQGMNPLQIAGSIGKTIADQPLLNLTPASAPLKILKDLNINVPSPTVGQAADLARASTIQWASRLGAEGVMSLQGEKRSIDPSTLGNKNISHFLYGDEPLHSFSNPERTANKISNAVGMPALAPFLIVGGIGLDAASVIPGEGTVAKAGIETVGKTVAKDLTKDIVTNTGKRVAKEEALTTLKGLLTYEDTLAKMGYSESQRAQFSLRKAQELFQWDQHSAETALNTARYFATEKKNGFNKLFATWIGMRDAAETTGVSLGKKFADIPVNQGWDVVKLLEDPSAKVAPEARKYIGGIRTEYNTLFTEAKKAKIDIGFLQNYITHLWKNSESEIAAAMKGASQNFRFAKERKFLTYDEGIAAGLTPKYTHPGEIMAEYTKRLEQTKANIQFVEGLKKEGLIVDTAVGRGKLGFSPITGPGFPVSKSKNYAGEVVQGEYYAPTEIAQVVNRLFAPAEETMATKALGFTSNVAKRIQDFTLSGGVPGTPFNAFSLTAGLQKELLAGRISSVGDFIRSFSQGATDEFFKANVETVKKMQLRNIPIHSTYDISHLINRGAVKNLLNDGKGWGVFDRVMNEPTFKRFWPQLQIHLFNDIEKSALQAGKGTEEAADIAAQAVKKFYGIVDSASVAKRNPVHEDLLSTAFFAPKFRESMIRIWGDTAKAISPVALKDGKLALNNPLSLENRTNTKFVVGAIATYFAFDKLNEHFTGKHLKDNPPGTEDKLLIPISEITGNPNDKAVIGIPYLSSLATIPRAVVGMAKHASELDFPQVGKDAKTFFSTLVKTPADLLQNENYFGQQIYDPADPKSKQLQDMGAYTFGNLNHPYIRALAEEGIIPFIPAKKDQPLYQTISKAVELPIRYYTESSLRGKEYYAVHDAVYKSLTEQEKSVFDTLAKKSDGSIAQKMAEAQLRLANPSVVRAEAQIAFDTAKKTGQMVDPFYQLPEANRQVVLRIDSLPPGDTTKSQLTSQNIGWLKEYWNARGQFFYEIKSENPDKQFAQSDTLRPTAEIQKKLDEYYSLPKGTGQRTAYSQANPDLVDYWNKKRDNTNAQRAELGLPPLPAFSNFSSGSKKTYKPFNRYSSLRTKNLAVKLKLPKAKKVKIKPAKLKLALPRATRVSAKVKIPRGLYA